MPVAPTYPGVYIEEIPSGVRTITGVATSIAAFLGFFRRGLMNRPVKILSPSDLEREFGDLDARSEAGYAIRQFFANGGREAWVVRTASGVFSAATVQVRSAINGATALTFEAGRFNPATHPGTTNPGAWGNQLRIAVDYPAPLSGNRFNVTVSLVGTVRGQEALLDSEVFRGLSMISTDPRFVAVVINDEFSGSKYVRVTAAGNVRPVQTGTLSELLDPFPTLTNAAPQVDVTIGTEGTATARLLARPTNLNDARARLETAIRAAYPARTAFAQASVSVVDGRLRILAGPTQSNARVTFAPTGVDATASNLGLSTGATLDGVLSDDLSAAFPLNPIVGQLQVTIGATGPLTLTLDAMENIAAARNELENRIRAAADGAPEFSGARVVTHTVAGTDRLIVLAGVPAQAVSFAPEGADTTASDLGLDAVSATDVTALVSTDLAPVPAVAAGAQVDVTIGADGPHTATITGAGAATTLSVIATRLQAAIRAAHVSAAFAGAQVAAYAFGGENRLVVLAGNAGDVVVFHATTQDGTTVTELGLDTGTVQANVQRYALGQGAAIPNTAQGPGLPGNDGNPPDAHALIGALNGKTGIYALEDADLFNILCIPRVAVVSGDNALHPDATQARNQAAAVITVANDYCKKRRAFFLMDAPNNVDNVQEMKGWLEANDGLRDSNSAIYFPHVRIPDPLNEYRLRPFGACGTIAGLYARIDGARGVWKAPAGTEATLANVQGFDCTLTDDQNGMLNPLGINCLRNFPIFGNISWGARTLEGSDQAASEWKYIPIRRTALYIEESLYRGTKWVVFEPNDEPLWAQIRLNVSAFMHDLFRQGAFQGTTPREAYFVKCDAETTIPNDVAKGIVNIVVGFAPLKPAEFVMIKIQQIAGQNQT